MSGAGEQSHQPNPAVAQWGALVVRRVRGPTDSVEHGGGQGGGDHIAHADGACNRGLRRELGLCSVAHLHRCPGGSDVREDLEKAEK